MTFAEMKSVERSKTERREEEEWAKLKNVNEHDVMQTNWYAMLNTEEGIELSYLHVKNTGSKDQN